MEREISLQELGKKTTLKQPLIDLRKDCLLNRKNWDQMIKQAKFPSMEDGYFIWKTFIHHRYIRNVKEG